MNGHYEVLSPWAEVNPRPLNRISPRTPDLIGKKIGLFCNSKSAAPIIMTAVEKRLAVELPHTAFSRYEAREQYSTIQKEGGNSSEFKAWLAGVDTVIAAVGD